MVIRGYPESAIRKPSLIKAKLDDCEGLRTALFIYHHDTNINVFGYLEAKRFCVNEWSVKNADAHIDFSLRSVSSVVWLTPHHTSPVQLAHLSITLKGCLEVPQDKQETEEAFGIRSSLFPKVS